VGARSWSAGHVSCGCDTRGGVRGVGYLSGSDCAGNGFTLWIADEAPYQWLDAMLGGRIGTRPGIQYILVRDDPRSPEAIAAREAFFPGEAREDSIGTSFAALCEAVGQETTRKLLRS
jgi:hypothetical protein